MGDNPDFDWRELEAIVALVVDACVRGTTVPTDETPTRSSRTTGTHPSKQAPRKRGTAS